LWFLISVAVGIISYTIGYFFGFLDGEKATDDQYWYLYKRNIQEYEAGYRQGLKNGRRGL
jgi:hypothetical protein